MNLKADLVTDFYSIKEKGDYLTDTEFLNSWLKPLDFSELMLNSPICKRLIFCSVSGFFKPEITMSRHYLNNSLGMVKKHPVPYIQNFSKISKNLPKFTQFYKNMKNEIF